MNKTTAVLLFFVAAFLVGLFVRLSPPEHFIQKELGMPTDMRRVKGVSGMEAASPILGMEPKPVDPKPYDHSADEPLMVFSRNESGPQCCPSPFTGTNGCICLTKEQKSLFASRGGNRTV